VLDLGRALFVFQPPLALLTPPAHTRPCQDTAKRTTGSTTR
jgi:hypothetical protein